MREKKGIYEYIGVYVDNLLIFSKVPQDIIDVIKKKPKFNLKGTGNITFHLGCDYFRDKDGVLCYSPIKYIEKMMDNYKRIFEKMPTKAVSPLEREITQNSTRRTF